MLWERRARVVEAERGIQRLRNGSDDEIQWTRWLMRKWGATFGSRGYGCRSGGERAGLSRCVPWTVDWLKIERYDFKSRWGGDKNIERSGSRRRQSRARVVTIERPVWIQRRYEWRARLLSSWLLLVSRRSNVWHPKWNGQFFVWPRFWWQFLFFFEGQSFGCLRVELKRSMLYSIKTILTRALHGTKT